MQPSQASLAQLSRELGINPRTVSKWRKRATVEDRRTGPREFRDGIRPCRSTSQAGDDPSDIGRRSAADLGAAGGKRRSDQACGSAAALLRGVSCARNRDRPAARRRSRVRIGTIAAS
ncbi:hypothetical protein [Rubellimicrobium sp. CFH 75288]|uniref:hypothetical protein n=1 Tax=Rubellimicrobium sp. CFH 75288 TaxID=2697034 RepID=UPI001FB808A4|nr:hypothetical protein [Rubellimicrobium sp. CFH 75288]